MAQDYQYDSDELAKTAHELHPSWQGHAAAQAAMQLRGEAAQAAFREGLDLESEAIAFLGNIPERIAYLQRGLRLRQVTDKQMPDGTTEVVLSTETSFDGLEETASFVEVNAWMHEVMPQAVLNRGYMTKIELIAAVAWKLCRASWRGSNLHKRTMANTVEAVEAASKAALAEMHTRKSAVMTINKKLTALNGTRCQAC